MEQTLVEVDFVFESVCREQSKVEILSSFYKTAKPQTIYF